MSAADIRVVGTRNVPLNFQIGEWRALSVPCSLTVIESDAVPPFESLPALDGAQGYLLKGLAAPLDAAAFANRPGWFHRVLREYPRHFVDMTTSFDDYLAKFSGKTRSTLKRKVRKFQDLSGGTIDWREYRSKDELAAFLPLATELSAKTYQERLLDAGLPDTGAFRTKALDLAAQGDVRAYLLFLNAKPVSYLYLPLAGTCAVYAYLGYDPAFAEHSPGTVLHLLATERLFADPAVAMFDFTEGAGQHKQLFATHTKQCVDVVLMKSTPSMRALTAAHAAFTRGEAAVGRALDAMGVKRRLKMLLRAFASRNA